MKENKAANNIELPVVNNTPTGLVEMEGEMFRGMSKSMGRPLWQRLLTVFFSFVIFILPGISLLFFAYAYWEEWDRKSIIPPIFMALVSILFIFGGTKAVVNNLKSNK